MANLVFAAAGAWLLFQLDAPNRRDFTAAIGGWIGALVARLRKENGEAAASQRSRA